MVLLLILSSDLYDGQSFRDALRYSEMTSSIDPSYDNYYHAGVYALLSGELDKSQKYLEAVQDKRSEVLYYLGIVYFQLGLYDKSTECFHYLLEKRNDIWQAYYYLGLIDLKQNRVDAAMEYFKETPDSVDIVLLIDYIEDYNQLIDARQDYEKGFFNSAIRQYLQVDYFFGYREIGLALAFLGEKEYKTSFALLDSVINHSDNETLIQRATYETAKIYYYLKDNTQARRYLKEYLRHQYEDQASFLLGMTFGNESRYDSAIYYFAGLPDSVDRYLFQKGRANYFLGFWGKAEELLLRQREDFPNSPNGDRATFILASINFKRKEYDHAIDFYYELVNTYPKSLYAATAQKSLGDAFFHLQLYERALETYEQVDEFEPLQNLREQTDLMIYETLYYLKKYSSLLEALQHFVDNNPGTDLALNTQVRIAKILLMNKEYYRSLSVLTKVIESRPGSSVAHRALIEKARVYQTIGDIDDVKSIYKELLAKEDAGFYHSYVAYELGVLYLEESKFDSALSYYNLLLKDEKYREKAIFEIAKIYNILGQNSESETMIDRLITEFPSSVFLVDAYILKSKTYRKTGYFNRAIAILEELIRSVGKRPEVFIEIGSIYFEIEDYLKARENYLLACEYFEQNRDDAARALLFAGDASVGLDDKKAARAYYLQVNLIAQSLSLKNQANAKINAIGEE
ncbi:MAG: tetratricopeptide repeat protein [bacterium]